jgi:carbamoyl-phosphate synthase large subunit
MTAEYDQNEEKNITQYIRNIAGRLKPFGSCNLQLRVDDKGQPKLFEINPRFSGTTYMRALFGYNEVAFIICKILGWEETPLIKKNGKVIRYYDERLIQN